MSTTDTHSPPRAHRTARKKKVAALLGATALGASVLANPLTPPPAQAASNHTGVYTYNTQTLMAWVKSGEQVDLTVQLAQDTNIDATYRVELVRPNGTVIDCGSLAAGAAEGTAVTGCQGPYTAGSPGVWVARIKTPAPTPEDDAEGSQTAGLRWNYNVTSGGSNVAGRVWAPRQYRLQNIHGNRSGVELGENARDVRLYYVDADGWQYRADHLIYNGVYSTALSNKLGLVDATGAPVYSSVRVDADYSLADTSTNPRHNIFFATPAADLPATATNPVNGSSIRVAPAPPVAEVDLRAPYDFQVTAPSAYTHAGTVVEWKQGTKYEGQVTLVLDTNNDGSFDPRTDRVAEGLSTASGTQSWTWDGLDASGAAIPASQQVGVQVLGQTGEIHFISQDVEQRGGLQVRRINGPDTLCSPRDLNADGDTLDDGENCATTVLDFGRDTLFWDDLRLGAKATVTAEVDGRNGFDSSVAGGVHDLPRANPTSTDTNSGMGGWGNGRRINDWTFMPLEGQVIIPSRVETPDPTADVRILKTRVGTGPVTVGDRISWKIEVDNAGPDTATQVEVNDLLPSNVDADSLEVRVPSRGTVAGTVWTVGDLAPGESASLELSAETNAAGTAVNMATVTSPEDPTVPPSDPEVCQDNTDLPGDTDNCDVVDVPVVPVEPEVADVRILKTRVGTEALAPGDQITWKIEVDNAGPDTATQVEVNDLLPAAVKAETVTFATPTQGSVTDLVWSVGTLQSGESASVELTGTISDDATGDVINMATVTSPEDPDVPPSNPEECVDNSTLAGDDDNCDIVGVPLNTPDLRIHKTLAEAKVSEDGKSVETTWTVQVKNFGEVRARQTVVTDIMPTGYDAETFKVVAASVAADTVVFDAEDGTWTWTPGTVKAGEQVEITFSVVYAATEAYEGLENLATVTSPDDKYQGGTEENDSVESDTDQFDKAVYELDEPVPPTVPELPLTGGMGMNLVYGALGALGLGALALMIRRRFAGETE